MDKKIMLEMLDAEVKVCTKCSELAENRTNTVFGKGNPNAKILLLGEAAGEQEDLSGIPFVGRAGKLLDNILKACNLNLDVVYIANILKCRPPGNRKPTSEEACNCEPFLKLQIKIINPKIIVCLGATAANNLLKIEKPIGQLRKQWFKYETIDVLCSYHPSYALRAGNSAKKEIWDDLQMVIEKLHASN